MEGIIREHHPMRSAEKVVSMIPCTKVFSDLDAKSDFLQTVLDEPTFNTPLGWFRWLRLPFEKMCSWNLPTYTGSNVWKHSRSHKRNDSILIAAHTVQEHDSILSRVLERATSFNKWHIRQSSVSYVGQKVSKKCIPNLSEMDARYGSFWKELLSLCGNQHRY